MQTAIEPKISSQKSAEYLQKWYRTTYKKELGDINIGEIIEFLKSHNKQFELYFTKNINSKNKETISVDIDIDDSTTCTLNQELVNVLFKSLKQTLKKLSLNNFEINNENKSI